MSESAQVAAEQGSQPAIRLLGDLQRINPQPGDVFLLKLDQYVPMDTVELIRQMLRSEMPGIKVIVLEKGMSAEIISRQRAELLLDKAAG